MGLNFSSTLDFIGWISRSLVSVIGKIFSDAKISDFAKAVNAEIASRVAGVFGQPAYALSVA